jgi:hypothetical protein
MGFLYMQLQGKQREKEKQKREFLVDGLFVYEGKLAGYFY